MYFNRILPSTVRSSKWSHYLRFFHPDSVNASVVSMHATSPAHLNPVYLIIRINIWFAVQIMKLLPPARPVK